MNKSVIGFDFGTNSAKALLADVRDGTPLCFHDELRNKPHAQARLWKDRTGYAEAAPCGLKKESFVPDPDNHRIFKGIYKLHTQLHNALGKKEKSSVLHNVMKDLLNIRESQVWS